MKKQFVIPTIEVVEFESENSIMVSGLAIIEGSSTTEQSKTFNEISNIFNGVL